MISLLSRKEKDLGIKFDILGTIYIGLPKLTAALCSHKLWGFLTFNLLRNILSSIVTWIYEEVMCEIKRESILLLVGL